MRGWVWLVVAALLLALGACARTPPEQRLRETIATLQTALQARQAGPLRQALAEDFVGPEGLDRDAAVRLAQGLFLRHRQIGADILGPLQVQMQPGHASVRFELALTGGAGGALPESARIYSVETGWRLVDGDWRLTSARWTPRL